MLDADQLHANAQRLGLLTRRGVNFWLAEFHRPGGAVEMTQVQHCDVCAQISRGTVTSVAYFDAKTISGSWGYLCVQHWLTWARYATVGTGRGQALLYPVPLPSAA